jgi:hypothetical protein
LTCAPRDDEVEKTQTIEQLYEEIGKAAIAHAEALSGKLLVYAEVEDGVPSADIFYVNEAGVVRFASARSR